MSKNKFLLILLNISISTSGFSQTFFRLKSTEQIIENKKNATLLIEVYRNNKILQDGVGFFISKKGDIAAPIHVILPEEDSKDHTRAKITKYGIRSVKYNGAQYKYRIKTYDGKILKDLSIIKCGNGKSLDLCWLKTNFKPKAWLNPSVKEIQKAVTKSKRNGNTPNYTKSTIPYLAYIGHCREPFNVQKTQNLGVYQDFHEYHDLRLYWNDKIELIHIDKENCGGDSGAPLFKLTNGGLVGMVTGIKEDTFSRKKWYIAISSREIKKFICLNGAKCKKFYKKAFKIPKNHIFTNK